MPIVTTGKDNVLTHRSAVSTLQKSGYSVVIGAVPRTLFMFDYTLTVEDKQVRGNYKLVIDTKNANLALTNYRLNVTLTAGSDHVSEYFIFLVCNINTDLG